MVWLKNLILAVVAVFAPIQAVLLTVVALVFSDLISGVLAARKRKEPITSSGLKKTVVKLLVYQSAILAGFLVEHYLSGPFVPVAKIVSGFIGVTELKSLLENLNEIQGGDIFQALISKISNSASSGEKL